MIINWDFCLTFSGAGFFCCSCGGLFEEFNLEWRRLGGKADPLHLATTPSSTQESWPLHKLNTALLSVQFPILGAMLLPFSYIFFWGGGWMYLVLLIVITLNRAIMVSLSWYHNHFKYLQIQKMITVINTGDKRLNNEIFQKPPTTTTCLSQF